MKQTEDLVKLYYAQLQEGEIAKIKEAEKQLENKYYLLAFKR